MQPTHNPHSNSVLPGSSQSVHWRFWPSAAVFGAVAILEEGYSAEWLAKLVRLLVSLTGRRGECASYL